MSLEHLWACSLVISYVEFFRKADSYKIFFGTLSFIFDLWREMWEKGGFYLAVMSFGEIA